MNKIVIVCGPTASGKTQLAIKIAKQFNGEIVSADSLAIYKGLDIGTAKPSVEEQTEAKHHLIDVVEPTCKFSVSDYEELALPIVEDIISRGKLPIICGGTGFYINSIIYKMSYGKTAENLEVREKFLNLAKTQGVDVVFDELIKVDPETAQKLHKNDLVRVVRALEIYYSTGKKKSEQNDMLLPRYDYLALTPDIERQELYSRIDKRVDIMIENGLVNEVKGLIESGITLENQCMQGIGYKETYEAIISNDYSNFAELIKLNSRHYAKRQSTFFRKLDGLIKVDPNIAIEIIKNFVNK